MTSLVGNRKEGKSEPLCKHLYPYGVWDNYCLTHAGALLGGLEMSGADPTGLGSEDRTLFSAVQRALYQGLDESIILTQYYWHYTGVKISLKNRDDPRSKVLSERREDFLNKDGGMAGSRIFWLMESPCGENMNSMFSSAMVKHLLQAPIDKESRQFLKAKLSNFGAWLAEENELKRQADLLTGSLNDISSRAEVLSPVNRKLSLQELWALTRATVNLDPSLLDSAMSEVVPAENWDLRLGDGIIKPVTVNGMDCLKICGAVPRYVRIASVTAYGTKDVSLGAWIKNSKSPLMEAGNFLVINRFFPYTKLSKSLMLQSKSNEIARQNVKISSLLKGTMDSEEVDKRVKESVYLSKKLSELEDAANSADRWGMYSTNIVLWDENPEILKARSQDMASRLSATEFAIVWESAGLMKIYPTLLPGYAKKSPRSVVFNTTQAGAIGLIYKSSIGVEKTTVTDEPTYIFKSRDNVPFSYTEFIEQKGLVIGVGVSRVGKTFAKNAIAAHFAKFGGWYRDIGVDAGAEPLARYFGEDAGIFRITDPVSSAGFAAFAAADPEDEDRDGLFFEHMLGNLRVMFSLNDAKGLQVIDDQEQAQLDNALRAVLCMEDREMRTLSQLYTHCPKGLQRKLERWVGDGPYSNLFDNKFDSLGGVAKRLGVYNLSGLKDIPTLAALAQREIFYRTSRLFENEAHLDIIKQVTIDECQYFLQVPGAAAFLAAKVRTWNKFNAGINLWTQSPEHYMGIPDWGMLKSSATSFFFGAEPKMDLVLASTYKKAFGLSNGQIDAIRELQPKKEFFIWQPDADVSKVIQLEVEKEQRVISTSTPSEAAIIQPLFKQYGNDPEKALQESIRLLGWKD